MGFRCPICHKDFGQDNNALIKHSKEAHDGIAKDIIEVVKKITTVRRPTGRAGR